jgi:hypothetical protein
VKYNSKLVFSEMKLTVTLVASTTIKPGEAICFDRSLNLSEAITQNSIIECGNVAAVDRGPDRDSMIEATFEVGEIKVELMARTSGGKKLTNGNFTYNFHI